MCAPYMAASGFAKGVFAGLLLGALALGGCSREAARVPAPPSAQAPGPDWESPDPALLDQARAQGFDERAMRQVEKALSLDIPSALLELRTIAPNPNFTQPQSDWLRASADALVSPAVEVLQADFDAACAANDGRAMAAATIIANEIGASPIATGACSPEVMRQRLGSGTPGPVYWRIENIAVLSASPHQIEVSVRVRNENGGFDPPYVLRSFGQEAAEFARAVPGLALMLGRPGPWSSGHLDRPHRWLGARQMFVLDNAGVSPCRHFVPTGARESGASLSTVSVQSSVELVPQGGEIEFTARCGDSGETGVHRFWILGAPPTALPASAPGDAGRF